MKNRFIVLGIILLYGSIFGLLLPWMISARDDMLVTGGLFILVIIVATSPDLIKYVISLFKHTEETK